MRATGEQITLSSHGYTATVTEVGATLRSLAYDERALIAGFSADEPMPAFNGAVLTPWPNRIGDGRYDFDGHTHQLPISEPSRNTALHGLVAWHAWAIDSVTAEAAELSTAVYPQRGYPFLLHLRARYSLDADGLRIEITARNDGDTDAPYGVSVHPWFVAHPQPLADWILTLPADQVITTDERLLPTGIEPVSGELDFRHGRPLGMTQLDHPFTGLAFEEDEVAHASLRSPNGTGVDISWGRECGWLQVCTGDEAGPELNRRAIAIEPMTCPPDAFRSGEGMIRLAPGGEHTAWWRFAAIG